MRAKPFAPALVVIALFTTLAACGSGGGSSGGAMPPTVGGGFVTGPTATPASTASPSGTPSSSPSPGSSPSPSPGGSPSPTPGNTATPSPGTSASPGPITSSSPGPTAAPTGYYAQGSVQDIASGLPIAGATVVLAPQVYAGSTPPPSLGSGSETTTASDGSFTLTGLVPGSNYLEVFENGYAIIHKPIAVNQLDNQLGILKITAITADEAAWLQKVNSDRAQYGAPGVVLDEILQEAAQHWDNYMANNGYFFADCSQTSDPTCTTATQYEQSAGAQYTHSAQNIAATGPNSTWTNAESGFLAESSNCPQPAAYSTCVGQTSAQYFLNLINPQFVWIGLAEDKNGVSYNPSLGPLLDYYTQEFGTPFQ
ncbi:MAG: carboxypeptidase regulatory-like domain-containing protein [Vulcanimicrobiaceae bacterium]